MKLYHIALIFIVFFIAVVIKMDLNIGKMEEIEQEKNELTESLYTSVSDAIRCVSDLGKYGGGSIDKKKMTDTFFASLYSSLGILSDQNVQAEVELYIPVILLCDSDGYYVYYYDDYKDSHGNTYANRIWTEKIPYSYKDDNFIYNFTLTDTLEIYDINKILLGSENVFDLEYHEFQTGDIYQTFRQNHKNSFLLKDEDFELTKKTAIITQLENVLSYYTFRHNSIARQNGITYSFAFPSGQGGEWANYIEDVNMLVVFQGYPYGDSRNYTFNKVASAGANVIKKAVYYIEKKSWYYLAHKEGCEKLIGNTNILKEPLDSLEECAKLGAYCDDCIEHGARVPELK